MTEVSNLVIADLQQKIKSKGSQKAVADELDISPAYLSDILNGRRNLSDNVLEKLGYENVTVHVKTHDVPKIRIAIETALNERARLDNVVSKVRSNKQYAR